MCSPLRQALLTREQFYMQYSKNLVERDGYRKQIRELGERCDEMQLQLFQKESQLLATEAKLKSLQLELPTPVCLRGCHLYDGLGSWVWGQSVAVPRPLHLTSSVQQAVASCVGNRFHANAEFRKMKVMMVPITSPWFQAWISWIDASWGLLCLCLEHVQRCEGILNHQRVVNSI